MKWILLIIGIAIAVFAHSEGCETFAFIFGIVAIVGFVIWVCCDEGIEFNLRSLFELFKKRKGN